jgi:hypothetical protein
MDHDEGTFGFDDDAPLASDGVVRKTTGTYTTLNPPDDGVLVYSHGFSATFRIKADAARSAECLAAVGWKPGDHGNWRTIQTQSRVSRWVMRGSTFLTGSGPVGRRGRPKRSPLANANRRWRTRLYSVGVEQRASGTHIELAGTRWTDCQDFFERVLGLAETEYELEHLLRAERYVALPPKDAIRLSEALGGSPASGRGPMRRKAYLLREHPVPVTIRTRSRSTAYLTLYRIRSGATYVYKLEASLRGRRNNRKHFLLSDIPKLDRILLDLVAEHGLTPVAKPARWEPRNRLSSVDAGAFDPMLRPLGHRAWRGAALTPAELRRLSTAVVPDCHMPPTAKSEESSETDASSTVSPGIRCPLSNEEGSVEPTRPSPLTFELASQEDPVGPLRVALYVPTLQSPPAKAQPTPQDPWEAIAQEVNRLPGALVEVVLREDEDPGPMVEAFLKVRESRAVDVRLVGSETWASVTDRLPEAYRESYDDLVLVVDPSAMASTHALSRWDPEAMKETPTQLAEHGDSAFAEGRAMSGMLWEALAAARTWAELTGGIVLVLTTDNRPPTGSNPDARSGFWTDARVRSWIGDSGRYWSHLRYRVDRWDRSRRRIQRRVVTLKDEAEGVVGRILWRGISRHP